MDTGRKGEPVPLGSPDPYHKAGEASTMAVGSPLGPLQQEGSSPLCLSFPKPLTSVFYHEKSLDKPKSESVCKRPNQSFSTLSRSRKTRCV